MAKLAKTDAERRAATQSAAKVDDRQREIEAALAGLGYGQCGVRSYSRITARVAAELRARLNSKGMTVTGDDPWDIETHKYGVKLRAVWNPKSALLKLIVVTGKGADVDPFGILQVACKDIWNEIDPILNEITGRRVTHG
jgi:hypothetical protein